MQKKFKKICINKQNIISLQQNLSKHTKMKYDYKQIAKCKIANKKYEVVEVNKEYYQVRCNRNKISNHSYKEAAIKRMLAEANYEKTSLFEQTTIKKEIIGKIVILDYSKVYGWNLKLQINETEAKNIIEKYNLKKDESINYLDSWLPEDRWKMFNIYEKQK